MSPRFIAGQPRAADVNVHDVPLFDELVFLHRKTRTLILTDLAMNFVGGETWMTKLWLRIVGLHRGFGTSRLVRSLVRDRQALRASYDRVLAWNFERVTVTHGVVLQRSGKRMLRGAWSWMSDGEA